MEIRDFNGRWPGSRKFKAANMRGSARENANGEYRIRLDDTENIDFWMEFTLVIRHDTQEILNQQGEN